MTGRLLLLNSITITPDTEKGFPHAHGRRDREQLPAAAHGGPDRWRDRRGPDRRGCCRWRRDAVAQHPRNHHDRSDLWSQPDERDQRHLALPGGAPAVAGGHPPGRRWPPRCRCCSPRIRRPRRPRLRPSAVKADKDAVLAEDPIVTQASDGDRSGRRQVLGSPQGPVQAQGDPDSDPEAGDRQDDGARLRLVDRRVDRRDRWRHPVDGRLARAGHHHARGPQEEEVRAVRAVGALRRSRPASPRASASSACRPCRRTRTPC